MHGNPFLVTAVLAAVFLSLFPALSPLSSLAAAQPRYQAWINCKKENGKVFIEAMCRGAGEELTYRMVYLKEGPSGVSRGSQAGKALCRPGEPIRLCRVGLGLGPGDTCKVRLEVLHRGEVVAGDTLDLDKPI